jgi:uncharacterized OB-fold protein
VCPKCHDRNLESKEFSKIGKVVCYAVDQSPLMGHGEKVPKPLAVIQLDDGPCVIADIVDCDPGEINKAVSVELVVRKWRRETNGNYMYGFKFRLVNP